MASGWWFDFLFLVSMLSISVFGKECTNVPTQISSHTVRAQLMSSDNETWKSEMLSHHHLNPTDESAWMDLLPRKLLHREAPVEEFDWAMLYRSLKSSDGSNARQQGGDFLMEVSLHDVRLNPDSIYGRAQQTNLEYLLMLDVDRLVWSFRNQAGLSTPGSPYGGWEAPDVELRGHFVGHYMSASAQMWASTHNDTLREKMSSVVDALYACQKKMGTGYLSAFPTELFDRFEAIKSVWAPYYTIHKIMAGLLDQYVLAGDAQALQMVVWMAEYFGNRVKNVILNYSIERHWTSLNEETGGMNDVLYKLYSITGDQKHLILAHLFDKPCFLGLLAVQADSLSGFHANTHIPVVIGAQRRYEITGDSLYMEIGTFFMDIVNSSHSYATGGTSVSEFWSDPKRLADTLSTENEESCTTYNMLKVSRNLFRWTKEMAYADYYERALINGVLSIQRGREPGVMIYMLPQGPGKSKARSYHGWGTKFSSFWCCYGTAIESFSKLGDSIYFEEKGSIPGLYVTQFIPSSFYWKSGGFVLNQKIAPVTSWDSYLRVSLTISSNELSTQTQSSTLNLRIPSWTTLKGAKAALNGQDLNLPYPARLDPASTSALRKAKRSNFKWTTIMERDIIVLMAEEARKGLKCDRGFKEKAYTIVAKVLSERYKVEIRMSHIQNHLRHVKKVYMTIKGLLSVSGFGWDSHDKVITADPDIWETYCQANPDARDFQGKSIDLFDEMGIVVGNDHARGSCAARAGSEAIPDNVPPEPYSSNQGRDDTESFVPLGEPLNIHLSNTLGSFATFPNEENKTATSAPPPRSNQNSSSNSKRKRANEDLDGLTSLIDRHLTGLIEVLRPIDPKVQLCKEIKKLASFTRAEKDALYDMMMTSE